MLVLEMLQIYQKLKAGSSPFECGNETESYIMTMSCSQVIFSINIGILVIICVTTVVILCYKLIKYLKAPPNSVSDQSGALDRNIKQFQTFISQQKIASSASFISPSVSIEQGISQCNECFNIPDVVECIDVWPHRRIFLGQVEWKSRSEIKCQGFLKECMNPLEMQLHRRLQHDNVVRFYWSNLADKPNIVMASDSTRAIPISFYCMEYCSGASLNSFLVYQGHTLHPEEVLSLIKDIVTGVQYLHRNGIAHRDLKSDNILIQHTENKCRAKLSDFDHAIDTNNNFELRLGVEQGKNGFGSPLYTAPEFILETIKNPGGKDFLKHDVYSLGLVIWECVTWIKCKQNSYNIQSVERGFHENSSITAPLLTKGTTDANHTNDIGQYRSLVTCSSTVHIPLIKEICKSLNLRYNKGENVLHKNGVFFKKGRLIDSKLMVDFYSKNERARPVFFREIVHPVFTKKINQILEGCWSNEPHQRFAADVILGMLTEISVF